MTGQRTRDAQGRFLRGISGNPRGRPPDLARRQRFIDAYSQNIGWPTRCARMAGYPEPGVRVAAVRLMRDQSVRPAIDALIRDHFARLALERAAEEAAHEAERRAYSTKRRRLFR